MEAKQTFSTLISGGPEPRRPGGLLKPERVQEMLTALLGWRLLPGDASLGRVREFVDASTAAAYAAFVVGLAGRDGHPFSLEQAGRRITVTLYGPLTQKSGRPMGVTADLLDTARALG